MRFSLCMIRAGEHSRQLLESIQGATILEVSSQDAVAAVNASFDRLVKENPNVGNVVVTTPTIGEPPATIVAVEKVHAWPVQVLERQGKPARSLVWVTDISTGLV